MPTVYGYSTSGNCHKVRLLLEQLGSAYRWIETDSSAGETRLPEFLARNPNGKVPVLELDDGRVLTESNAILFWLAEGTGYLPEDAWQRAQALSWMFFEQYNHEPNIATLRFWLFYVGEANLSESQRSLIPAKRAGGEAALALMDEHLANREWFAGSASSLADIVLFAYTHVAEMGGFRLDDHPNVCAWLKRVEALPGFVAMD